MIYCSWWLPAVRNAASILNVMVAAQDYVSTLGVVAECFAAATFNWLTARDENGTASGEGDEQVLVLRAGRRDPPGARRLLKRVLPCSQARRYLSAQALRVR